MSDAPRELVDDPYQPGQKCSPAMAKVHPIKRLGAAIASQIATPKTEES